MHCFHTPHPTLTRGVSLGLGLPMLPLDFQAGKANADDSYMVTFPYPYMNGKLHLGHVFTLLKASATPLNVQLYQTCHPSVSHDSCCMTTKGQTAAVAP